MTRVTSTAARRGAPSCRRDQVLRGLAALSRPRRGPAGVDKLRRDAEASGAEIELRGRLVAACRPRARSPAPPPASAPAPASAGPTPGPTSPPRAPPPSWPRSPGTAELLRGVGAKLVAAGRDAVLCAPDAEGCTVVLFCAPRSSLDCGRAVEAGRSRWRARAPR